MKPKQITISEYQSLFIGESNIYGNVAISAKLFAELEQFVLKNETYEYLKLTYKKGLGKALQAQNYVGVIQTKDGTTIEILPKIANLKNDRDGSQESKSKKILYQMLKTLKNSPFKNINLASLKSTNLPILEIFISMFLSELTKLVQRGIKSDYIMQEENIGFLKGKLKLKEQIKHNTIHRERFYVAYDEYLQDRIENRLIKATLHFLYKKSKLNSNQQRIREFLFVFDDISDTKDAKNDFASIKTNRQMRDYELVLSWCRVFLLGNSFSPYKGNDVAFALLYDMNELFESYVGAYLKKHFDNVSLQDKKHHLAYLKGNGRFRLKPDIVINNGSIIADTKWKLLDEDKTHQGVSQADMYQLFAYGKKYRNPRCEELYLIYPKSQLVAKEACYSFNETFCDDSSLKLQIVFFDLENICFVDKLNAF